MSAREQRAGTYARERYRRGLRSYRRRMRGLLVVFVGAALIISLLLDAIRGVDWWSYVVGAVVGLLIAVAADVHGEPPEFIAKWGRGADGEEQTGKELARLEKDGWRVRHDIELDRGGNADHVVRSPSGRVYVLETKRLAGSISLERGRLTRRYADDPDAVHGEDLSERMKTLVEQVRRLWAVNTDGHAPPAIGVVVIWGSFEPSPQRHRQVTYVRGDGLASFLRFAELETEP